MSKKKILKINVSKQEFKRIKKGKQTIIVRLNNDEEIQNIKNKDKIVIQGKIDRFKKQVKEIHVYSTLEELINNIENKNLGYKKKVTLNYDNLTKDYNNEDIKKYGFLVIELKRKKYILRKMLLGVLIVVLLFFGYCFINDKLKEIEAKRFYNSMNKLSKDRTDYVFVEINPSFVLTVKDNKVSDVACLNDDCISIYNDIDVNGKNINDSIDTIYDVSKEKGFDTSNGVKVKTSNNVNIETKDYIIIERIDVNKEKELLKEIKNNEDIKNISNDDYYTNLWNELKKDSDYDNVYSCHMNVNELECYIKDDFIIAEKEINGIDDSIAAYPKIQSRLERIEQVFKKFKINVSTDNENIFFPIPAGKLYIGESIFHMVTGNSAKEIYYSGKIKCDFYKVNLTEINLLKPNNISYERDENFYEDDFGPNSWKTTISDEFHIVEEKDFNYCNEVQCVKIHEIRESYCVYDDSQNYWHWSEEDVPDVYQECDLGYKNCRYVPAEKYDARR